MNDGKGRLLISILFPIGITLYLMLLYLVILVILNEKSIDLGLFSTILILFTGVIRVSWIFIPQDIKDNFITMQLFNGYARGKYFLNSVVNSITVILILIGVILGFISYIL